MFEQERPDQEFCSPPAIVPSDRREIAQLQAWLNHDGSLISGSLGDMGWLVVGLSKAAVNINVQGLHAGSWRAATAHFQFMAHRYSVTRNSQ